MKGESGNHAFRGAIEATPIYPPYKPRVMRTYIGFTRSSRNLLGDVTPQGVMTMNNRFTSRFGIFRQTVKSSGIANTPTKWKEAFYMKSAGLRIAVSFLILILALCLQSQPVLADQKRIAIIFSQETANKYFDPFTYGQLFASIQHQAMMLKSDG